MFIHCIHVGLHHTVPPLCCLMTPLDTAVPVPPPTLQAHSRADIRKASVFFLVELWCTQAGEDAA